MSGIDLSIAGPPESSSPRKHSSTVPGTWTDEDFREAFESLRIPNELFRHREHIRLAWIYSRHFPQKRALAPMVRGIQALAKHHGAAAKYHHTITVAWMRLVRHAALRALAMQDFPAFAAAYPHLLNPRLLEDYFSKARLQSDAARHGWLGPDLRPLPCTHCAVAIAMRRKDNSIPSPCQLSRFA
jgi:hypothetical protein